jgi:hypothetical protein
VSMLESSDLKQWFRRGFLIAFPIWTAYTIMLHYWLWRASTNPADRAGHGFRALAWGITALIIVLSLIGVSRREKDDLQSR